MRKILGFLFILHSVNSFSQDTLSDQFADIPRDTIKRAEIGYCFLGVNANSELIFSDHNTPSFEVLNGILFRYKLNKLSIRFTASYVKRNYNKDWPLYCTECTYGSSGAEDYKLGAGLQFTPLKTKEYFYSFADISYKRRNEEGLVIDYKDGLGIFDRYQTKTNGVDIIAGFGSKIRIYRIIHFSTEAGYNAFAAQSKKKSIDNNYAVISNSSFPYHFQTFTFKFYLSLMF